MDTVLIIVIILGVIAPVLGVIALMQGRHIRTLKQEKDGLTAQKADAEQRTSAAEKQAGEAEKQVAVLQARLEAQAEAQRQLNAQREKDEAEQREQQEKDLNAMKDAFKALAAENSDEFRRKSADSISELLKPIREKFSEFDKSVKETHEKNVAQNASMKSLIEKVMEQSKTVGDEAKNLANALTGYSKVQGDFGEMLLVDVLKNSGLVEGIHFRTQGVITDEAGHEIRSSEGRTLIPDVLVFYPDDTMVVIDSKVSLSAYNSYMNAESIEERMRFAKAHVASVRDHIDELKKKNYASYVPEGKSKVDYNIMFVPMEGAFRLMLEEAPTLWQLAKDNNVLIVSQMTLVIVLNMIQMSWKQHNQEKNIQAVYDTAEELMGQLRGWMDAYVKLGDALGKASDAYDESRRKLVDSNQSVMKKIDKLERLGLAPKRSSAKLKPGARMVQGKESIIPKELSSGLDAEEPAA
ncbi:MAG: DNA recombination protein RmuC [Bacteroidales bacterium]|nr:DNA recombination protein RmuC [Bacteroidales bacterium]